jgi:hypothetical protein
VPTHHLVDPIANLVQQEYLAFKETILEKEISIEIRAAEILGKVLAAIGFIRKLAQLRKIVALDTGVASGLCYAADMTIANGIRAKDRTAGHGHAASRRNGIPAASSPG